jgi:hypothetical protein
MTTELIEMTPEEITDLETKLAAADLTEKEKRFISAVVRLAASTLSGDAEESEVEGFFFGLLATPTVPAPLPGGRGPQPLPSPGPSVPGGPQPLPSPGPGTPGPQPF